MPYSIGIENDVLRVRLNGRVTGAELNGCCEDILLCEQQAKIVPHRVTDMTRAEELEVTYPEISALVEKRRNLQFPNRFKWAIVANTPLQLGFARMFQTLSDENPKIAVRIFSDVAAAEQWIANADD